MLGAVQTQGGAKYLKIEKAFLFSACHGHSYKCSVISSQPLIEDYKTSYMCSRCTRDNEDNILSQEEVLKERLVVRR